MRIKATISYDGKNYSGFQVQKDEKTVASAITEALSSLNIETRVLAAGRTDKGVHAIGQVISFEIPDYWQDLEKLKREINLKLIDIRFLNICCVEDDFNPMYGAKRRTYRYLIRGSLKNELFYKDYCLIKEELDLPKIKEALSFFIGKHDFSFFKKIGSEDYTTIREIYNAKAIKRGEFVVIFLSANGFLRSQVRMIVSIILKYSDNLIKKEDILGQLNLKHKVSTSLAPANGLYLSKITYK